jgi:hypothetical protein
MTASDVEAGRWLAKPLKKTDNLDDPPTTLRPSSSENPVMRHNPHRRCQLHRFRPVGEAGMSLDSRVLPSGAAASAALVAHHVVHARPLAHHVTRSSPPVSAPGRITPAQEINKQYDLFYQNFQTQASSYVQSLDEQSTGTIFVSTVLTAPYLAGSASMSVQDAAVFGPEGTYTTPVIATASVGSVPVGTFTIIGSSGNTLAINTTQSSAISLAAGTTLSADVTSTASSSAASIFPTYITASTRQLAVNLIAYFDRLPFKLPRKWAPPHFPQSTGAIQQYVDQVLVGPSSASLEQSLLAIPLPLTPGSDLQIYNATVLTALNTSRLNLLNGVEQIFAHKLPVVPSNYAGGIAGVTSGSSSTSGTGSTGTTGSSTTGAA